MALNKLLNTASYRRLQLIEILISDDNWRTLEILSNQLGCSRRTIIADIQMINGRSKDYFYIKTSKQRGIKLIASDLFHMEDVYQDLIEENLNFQIIKKIIELDVVSREELAELLYISTSSLNRNIKQINIFLVEYDLNIQSSPIKMIGNEKQIRYFYSIFLGELYSANMDEFQHPLKNTVIHFLDQLEEENESHPYSFITRYRIIIWLIVCADRIAKGYLIEEIYTLPKSINKKTKIMLTKLIEQLPFEPPEKEIAFLMYIYSNNHREFNQTDLADDDSLKCVYEELVLFIEKVKEETTYTIDDEPFLLKNLMGYCFYHDFFKGPSKLLFSPERRLVGPSLKIFNEFIDITTKIAKQHPDNPWNQENRIEEFIFMLILYWRGLVNQVVLNKEKIDVLIVSYIGIQQELFLCDVLHARYPTTLNCQPASEKRSFEKDYQIVLTDYSVKWIQEKMSPSEKVIGINMIPTKRDWKKIEETIKFFE